MKFLSTILFILIACFVLGQNRFAFEHLTIEDGLANNSVRSIFQDEEGYLWFGTLNGLSRYDGQQFKTFDYNRADSSSISNNKIREIIQDGVGYIWLMTYNDHAHRFDPKTESFVNFPTSLNGRCQNCSVHAIYESSPGVVWLYLTGNGCVRIISHKKSSEYSVTYFSKENGLPSNSINFIQSGKNGGVWIGTTMGLCYLPDDRFDENEPNKVQTFLRNPGYSVTVLFDAGKSVWAGCQSGEVFQIVDGNPEFVWKTPEWGGQNNNISFIEPIRKGQLCVGSRKGLLLFNEDTGEKLHLTTRNSNLNTSYIISCYHDLHGDLWLVTSRRGITRFQPQTKQFTYYSLQPELRQSILEGEKQVFQEDRNGDLWVGIYGGGISRFNRKNNQFEQYLHEKNNPASLSSNLILSVFADRSGNFWAGTYKQGVNKVNLQQNNFHSQENNLNINQGFNNEVRAVFEDSRKWIWTGNIKGEVVIYDQNLKKKFSLNEFPGAQRVAIATGVYAFEEDQQHNIWIGTKGDGIFVVKNLPESNVSNLLQEVQLIHLTSGADQSNSLSHNDIFDLHEDRVGQMWVALYHGGVNVVRHPLQANQEILYFMKDENDKYAISDNRARCILEDKNGNLWIGTARGLNFLSKQYLQTDIKRFRKFERTNNPGSLTNNDIISLVQDSNGTIWMGTYGGGLNKLRTGQDFTFDHLGQAEGLSSNLILSIVEGNGKNLWIGTDFGLCKYNPDENSLDNYYASDGLEENFFSEGGGIKTSSNQLLFGTISGMVWFHPDSVQKSERQVPVVLTNLLINGEPDKEKLNLSRRILNDSLQSLKLKYNDNFVTFEFAALDYKAPSKIQYAFKLENYEQNWNRSGNLNKAIYRELKPGDYLFRFKASNSDGLWVNPEMKLALTIEPPVWKTIWAYLIYLLLTIGVFFLARRIILERIRLKHEVEFEKQLAEDKLKFYTSISHEFKTPLALILGPVEDLLSNKNLLPEVSFPLRMVKRNTKRLLELIEQLMDFRKIQKGFFEVNREKRNVVFFLNEIYNAFVPLAERNQIEFWFHHEQSSLEVLLDYKSLEKIVFNLLSNAFKYAGHECDVALTLAVDEKNKQLEISVTDKGEGIREQDLPHIFERFSFGNRSRWKDEPGTGIGLSLTKELVELQGGTINVESTLKQGSCFTVRFPLITRNEENGAISERTDLSYAHQFIGVAEKEEVSATAKEESSKKHRETILVVEDNLDLQDFLSLHLSTNYRVLQAKNGKEGLELAKNENPNLIICDIMMPEMDGIELTAILKNEFHTSHIPIILLTAKSLDEHKIEGIETGADDYITKPFNMVYLQKRIENILKQRKQLKERFSRDLHAEPNELASSVADQEFLSKVVSLVDENMANPDFSIDNLLEHFSFGRTVFYKKMKGISGYSPKDFVRIIRMKKAGTLLLNSSITVTEVSFEVGFNDPDYFSKQFKKHFGENPSEYQKRHR